LVGDDPQQSALIREFLNSSNHADKQAPPVVSIHLGSDSQDAFWSDWDGTKETVWALFTFNHHLPRQARDRHIAKSQKETSFMQGFYTARKRATRRRASARASFHGTCCASALRPKVLRVVQMPTFALNSRTFLCWPAHRYESLKEAGTEMVVNEFIPFISDWCDPSSGRCGGADTHIGERERRKSFSLLNSHDELIYQDGPQTAAIH
jgi:hypothetical protein